MGEETRSLRPDFQMMVAKRIENDPFIAGTKSNP